MTWLAWRRFWIAMGSRFWSSPRGRLTVSEESPAEPGN